MKKVFSLLVLVAILIPCLAPILRAQDTSTQTSDTEWNTLKKNSVTYTCTYHTETGTVTINGTVNHDTMIRCRDYLVEVYRVLPGESMDTVFSDETAQPLVSTEIAVKFNFSLSAQTATERFSGYAVVLRAPDGKLYRTGDPVYAQIPTAQTEEARDMSSFKGISAVDVSVSGNLGAGSAIVPVYLDRLLSESSAGYLYHVDQGYRYFDKPYVDNLDSMVRSYSASGSKVYLQLLLPASGIHLAVSQSIHTDSQYYMPNVYSQDILPLLSSISTFLVSRYDDPQAGLISGLILGTKIDQKAFNDHGELSAEQYAKLYAFYLLVMGGSARTLRPELTLVLPFSDANDYVPGRTVEGNDYSPSALLESILSHLTQMGCTKLSCITMIESSVTPLGIDDQFLTGDKEDAVLDGSRLGIENLTQYETYLTSLTRRYANAPTGYLYRWTPDKDLSGNALACAYTYAYYSLLRENGPSSFILSLATNTQLTDLKRIIRYIDTSDSFSVTQNLLVYFQATQWGEVIQGFSQETVAVREHVESSVIAPAEKDFKGSFSYVDFSTGNVNDWFAGASCEEIKFNYNEEGLRGVYAQMNTLPEQTYGELLCVYEYPETLIYTPYIEFSMEVTDSALHDDSIYEVTVTLGSKTGSTSASYLVRSGERTTILLDIHNYHEAYLAEYLKFDVRMLSGDAENFQFWLFEMTGHSQDHTSEELENLIAMERLKIRNQLQVDEQEQESLSLVWTILGILVAVTAVGVLLMTRFKQEDRDSDTAGRSSDSSHPEEQ